MEMAAAIQKLPPGAGAERESGAMVSSGQTRAKMGSSRNKTMQLPRPALHPSEETTPLVISSYEHRHGDPNDNHCTAAHACTKMELMEAKTRRACLKTGAKIMM